MIAGVTAGPVTSSPAQAALSSLAHAHGGPPGSQPMPGGPGGPLQHVITQPGGPIAQVQQGPPGAQPPGHQAAAKFTTAGKTSQVTGEQLFFHF